MNWIIEKVKEIQRKYGSEELEVLVSRLGAEVHEILEGSNIKEVYFPHLEAIAIKPDLHPYERNYLIAHALGHHLLHRGSKRDFINLHEEGLSGSLELGRQERTRKEKEADLFAAYLLIPEERLEINLKSMEDPHYDPVPELAEEFEVPEELMRKRLELRETLKQLSLLTR